MDTLDECRREIDRLDAQVLEALAQRLAVCREIARYKAQRGLPVVQPERSAEVKRRRAELGAALGLDAGFVAALYELIIAEACRVQDEIV